MWLSRRPGAAKSPPGVDDLGGLAYAVVCQVATYAQVGYAPAGDGDVCVLQQLARVDAHQVRVLDHELCGLLPLRDPHQRIVALPKRHLAEAVNHGVLAFSHPRVLAVIRRRPVAACDPLPSGGLPSRHPRPPALPDAILVRPLSVE